ncbi:MAG: hypothetical protein KGJ13_11175 [Patescibacteria group bacterium]|nr:hypothetical protein [Patescibacteria group bacterium]
MKFACEKCGHINEVEAQQNRAAKSRWSNMTPEEKSAEMSRIRRKGIKKPKRTARRANDSKLSHADRRPASD